MANWETLYSDAGERMELLQVADGYLLRNWVRSSDHAGAMQMALVFIPGALPAAPVVVDTPAVTPLTATVGDMLTCSEGNWDGVPVSYDYAWRRDSSPVVGSGNTYTTTAADAGTAIDCVVTAHNAGGETAAPPSNAVAVT